MKNAYNYEQTLGEHIWFLLAPGHISSLYPQRSAVFMTARPSPWDKESTLRHTQSELDNSIQMCGTTNFNIIIIIIIIIIMYTRVRQNFLHLARWIQSIFPHPNS